MSQNRIFGGDAAKQRAEAYAEKVSGIVVPVDQLPAEIRKPFGLNPWDRKDGIHYAYAVVVPV